MARGNENGWDFIKVGTIYQYKEDWFIAMVTILEDQSNPDEYRFKLQVEESNFEPPQNGEFEVTHNKNVTGYYSGMLQFYEEPEYVCEYKWKRNQK